MKILVCSQNLVGFLSAVHVIFKQGDAETIVSDALCKTFLDEYIDVTEDLDKARAVKGGIIKKGGMAAYADIADAYLSCDPKKEQILLDYLRLFFRCGKAVFTMYDRPEVIALNDILNKVRHEVHRVSAFIRLMEMTNGAYYGYFNSDNDILEKIVPVLKSRLGSQMFVIHDYKRGKIGVCDGQKCDYMLVEGGVDIQLSDRELLFQTLWKQYHKNVSITERENPRLQCQFLPKKYRHFMHEF